MAATILPQDVTEHLEAAIQLSNRRVHLRFLDEAEGLLALNFPSAAVVVVGVVLELILVNHREEGGSEDQQRAEKWFDLRNHVTHAVIPTVSLDEAKEMVEGVRTLLRREIKVSSRVAQPTTPSTAAHQVRGKYKFVPTSAAECIGRKPDELRLEDHEHGH